MNPLALFCSLILMTCPAHLPANHDALFARVTAYNATVEQCDADPTITASGKTIAPGMAACPRNMPFGAQIEIAGQRYSCEDRMSLKYSNSFDIYMPQYDDSIKFGVQWLRITIL